MQYNLLFYGFYTDFCTPENNNTSQKDAYLRTLLGHFQPHIFTVNELGRGEHNMYRIRDSVLNVDGVDYFETATYTNSTHSWFANALYYDSRKFGLYHEAVPSSILRDINLYTLYYKTDDLAQTGDTTFLTCVVAHLKAGQSTQDQQTRTAMVANVMNYLNDHNYSGNIMFMGDFNMKSSFEQAYQMMVNHANPHIRFYDPIGVSGVWGNNPAMAPYHTQSPRTGSHPCFVTGGLDDRYDFILASHALMEGMDGFQYVEDSYTAIGQDGKRYNQSLINPPNHSQPPEIINALYHMSDHLPVMLDLVAVEKPYTGTYAYADADVILTPNPVNDQLTISLQSAPSQVVSLKIFSLSGALLYTHDFSGSNMDAIRKDVSFLPASVYIVKLSFANGHSHREKLVKN